jgi:DNA modification methylase
MPPKVSWPADKVTRRKVSELIPYARNARTHSPEQVAQIAASIKEWGFTNPVLVDEEDGIIAGHGRILAAQLIGLADVPTMVAKGWTEAQKRAYVIADNKLALNAGWDMEKLAIEFGDLASLDFDLTLTGFGDIELADIMADKTLGLTDPDEVPEAPETPVTATGDTWLLGKHRLRCGDSTSADDVAALLAGVEPHLMVTDPPYGVDYDPNWRAEFGEFGKNIVAKGKVANDDRADWREVWALFPGDVAYVWHGALHALEVAESLAALGLNIRSQIIWVKPSAAMSRGHYHWRHEPMWYAVRNKGHWTGDRKQNTVWEFPGVNPAGGGGKGIDGKVGHGTQKPVECMRRPIVNNSSPGQAVYEPFSGSGTTIIAGEMESRAIYAMELAENYCDVAVTRWQNFTGLEAVLESTGETFNAIAEKREAA